MSCLRRILFKKQIWPAAHCFRKKSSVWSLCDAINHFMFFILSIKLLVVKLIRTPLLRDQSNTICSKQYWRKCYITKPLLNQTFWDINRTNTNSSPNQFIVTYVNTHNIIIPITRLVSILFHFHAVSLCLLLNHWHRNNPEPKVQFFLQELR